MERSESGLAEQKTLKKQRVSLTKSSVLKSKQHNNQNYNKNEIYVSTCLVFKPLGAKQSSRYCQKLSRILLPPVSLSIIFTLISFRNPWWPSSVKCLKNSTWGTEAPGLNLRLHACKVKIRRVLIRKDVLVEVNLVVKCVMS